MTVQKVINSISSSRSGRQCQSIFAQHIRGVIFPVETMPELVQTICLLEEHFSTSFSSAKLKNLKSTVLGERPAKDPEIYVQMSQDDLDVFLSQVIALQCDMTVLEYNAIQQSSSVYVLDMERQGWASPVLHKKDLFQLRKIVKAWMDLLYLFSGEAACSGV